MRSFITGPGVEQQQCPGCSQYYPTAFFVGDLCDVCDIVGVPSTTVGGIGVHIAK